ncbi:hypothetical protein P7F88_25400 [Vibrio hannami]|uniref:hypothetical protein n=1 Tax=Vibrio hannami TaxID=2717094 RepID=UPI00240ED523|nr:hypothetical protein [Vibrio hannami]MDG3089202.1 hypothetical protein [Vibrio hannami]
MSRHRRNALPDEMLLEAMHLTDNEGLTTAQAGEAIGVSKNTIIGVRNRINAEIALNPCLCRKPENIDGGMPERWWQR